MKILVLCHGNVNRSPFVAALLRHLGHPHEDVWSAGFLPGGKRAAKKMREAAALLGMDLEAHRSTQAQAETLRWADLILYMDGGNRGRLVNLCGISANPLMTKARCLASFAPSELVTRIPDPAFMERGGTEFSNVVTLMHECTTNLAKLIAEGKDVLQK